MVSLRRILDQIEKYMNSSFADEILLLFVEGEDKLMIDDEHIVLWWGIVGV